MLEYLYKDIYPKIKSYILANSGNIDDALDIFQDALVVLCKQIKLNRFDEKYEISAFLYSICRNLWINKAKRESRLVSLQEKYDHIENEDFSEYIITKEKERLLKEIAGKLGKKCFELLQQAIFYQSSTDEIIKNMGFSTANAVKTQKYKCKQKLIKLIDENPGYKEVVE